MTYYKAVNSIYMSQTTTKTTKTKTKNLEANKEALITELQTAKQQKYINELTAHKSIIELANFVDLTLLSHFDIDLSINLSDYDSCEDFLTCLINSILKYKEVKLVCFYLLDLTKPKPNQSIIDFLQEVKNELQEEVKEVKESYKHNDSLYQSYIDFCNLSNAKFLAKGYITSYKKRESLVDLIERQRVVQNKLHQLELINIKMPVFDPLFESLTGIEALNKFNQSNKEEATAKKALNIKEGFGLGLASEHAELEAKITAFQELTFIEIRNLILTAKANPQLCEATAWQIKETQIQIGLEGSLKLEFNRCQKLVGFVNSLGYELNEWLQTQGREFLPSDFESKKEGLRSYKNKEEL